MEAVYFSETSVNLYYTACYDIPEENNLHNHRCGNLKSQALYKFV
jgi:hypothetical protein